MLWKPNPADWLTWRRTLDSWGFSPLNQINRNNVAQMKMAWTRGMGPGNVQEATPLVYNGVMYLPNPSDLVQAIDAEDRRPAVGVPAQAARGPRQVHAGLRHQPQPRDLRRQDHRHERRRLRLRARRQDRRSSRGKRRSSTTRKARSRPRVRSSPTARSSPAAAASPKAARTPA